MGRVRVKEEVYGEITFYGKPLSQLDEDQRDQVLGLYEKFKRELVLETDVKTLGRGLKGKRVSKKRPMERTDVMTDLALKAMERRDSKVSKWMKNDQHQIQSMVFGDKDILKMTKLELEQVVELIAFQRMEDPEMVETVLEEGPSGGVYIDGKKVHHYKRKELLDYVIQMMAQD